MEFTINQSALTAVAARARRFVAKQTTLPVASCLLVEAKKTALNIQATDLEKDVSISVLPSEANALKVSSIGAVAVNAALFFGVVSSLRAGPVDVKLEGETLILESGETVSRLQTLPAEDFPSCPDLGDAETLLVDSGVLQSMINATQYAACKEDTRPILTGVNFHLSEGRLAVAATDTHQLARAVVDQDGDGFNLIIPADTARELPAFLSSHTSGPCRVQATDNLVRFSGHDWVIGSRLIKGLYPRYEKVMPTTNVYSAFINRAELLDVLSRIVLFSGEHDRCIVTPAEGRWSLAAHSDSGSITEDVVAEQLGEMGQFAVNVKFLRSAIQSIEGDGVVVKMNAPLEALLIEPVENEDAKIDVKLVIMPMQT